MNPLLVVIFLVLLIPENSSYDPHELSVAHKDQLVDNHSPRPVTEDPPAMAHCAITSKPLTDWASGFLTGNGNMGVIMCGDPYSDTLIINSKLYLPTGSKEVMPDLSIFKDEFRNAGLAAGKDGPATVHNLMLEKSGQVLVNTDPFHPAFFLRARYEEEIQCVHKLQDDRRLQDRRTKCPLV